MMKSFAKSLPGCLLLPALFALASCISGGGNLTRYVDPYIGSGGHGHVFVGAHVPFGAVQVGPSNYFKGWDWCSGYHYSDSLIIGFPQLHLSGTGIGDLGDVLIMPYTGAVRLDKGTQQDHRAGYASRFSHDNETVRPGYYSVELDDSGVQVELTASERVAFHRYRFPAEGNGRIIIDLKEGINDQSTDTYLEQIDSYTLKGYRSSSGWVKRQQVFFAIRSSVPLDDFAIYDEQQPLPGKQGQGKAVKGLISFAKAPETVSLKIGISPVSADNALENIEAEIPHWNFDRAAREADRKWERELGKITVETGDQAAKRIFYTAMYHALTHPSLFNDHNGEYMGSDWQPKPDPGFDNYTIFSTWDTYRAAHPLYILTHPGRVADFVNSMLAIYDQTGLLPVWHLRGYDTGTMVGHGSFEIITEAYMKGIGGFDPEHAYRALTATARSDVRGLEFVRNLEPIYPDRFTNRPVAMGLEYAVGDGGIAVMARALGHGKDYAYFLARARNYKLYYDPQSGFPRGKLSTGEWREPFDPLKSVRPWATDYAEGNAWQYLWLAPQDVEGLIGLLGGEAEFGRKLDTFFTLENKGGEGVLIDLTGEIGQYAHGNEPSHHIAYLYAFLGEQWKTAALCRRITAEFYSDQPDGLIGNEDCGQMSAWYIFSSLGFYPVFTASGQYVIGSPLFDKATIRLENGKRFTVETAGNSPENRYVQSIELDGEPYPYSYITHDAIMRGGLLKIRMGGEPNRDFGADPEYRPYTLTGMESRP